MQPSVPHQPERPPGPESSGPPGTPQGPPAPPPARPPGGGPSGPPAADGTGEPPRAPGASEATRLLCAGAYLDESFRNAVIEELYVHDERTVAPSLGFDAARVLAHALAARRAELGWSAAILLLWIAAIPLTSGLVLPFLLPGLLLALAARMRGQGPQPAGRRMIALTVRLYALLMVLQAVLLLLSAGFDAYGWVPWEVFEYVPLANSPATYALGATALASWTTLVVLLGLAWIVFLQRDSMHQVLNHELSRSAFPDIPSDPAEKAEGLRSRRLLDRVRLEQHHRIVMYRTDNPFCGAGQRYQPWSLSVELRPRKDVTPQPVDNSAVIARIVPLLRALRVPSPGGSAGKAAFVRDRLRELEIDEVVFLPVDGLPTREHAPYTDKEFARHRDAAVEEGGETRRHFLRVRVGGWGEEIVATVFVRVHTQGGMLMLEVAPHVLRPVKPLFTHADRIGHDYARRSRAGKVLSALLHAPGSAFDALLPLTRGAVQGVRLLVHMQRTRLPDGPKRSVRELAADPKASLFQEMDLNRYLQSIQDRVASGVKEALHEAGWRTDEFEQQIVNVAQGGIFIGSAKDSAVAVGDNNIIANIKKKAQSAGRQS